MGAAARALRFWQEQERYFRNLTQQAKENIASAVYDKEDEDRQEKKEQNPTCPVFVVRDYMAHGMKQCGKPVEPGTTRLSLYGGAESVFVQMCEDHHMKNVNLSHQKAVDAGELPKCCLPWGKDHHPFCSEKDKKEAK